MSSQTLIRGRRLLTGTTVAALTAGVLAFSPTAHAAEAPQEIVSGSISWGLKSSFRTYLASPIAKGKVTVAQPATDDGSRTTFAYASGSWASDSASVGAQGSVTFTGHEGALDLTISDPRIVVTGSSAQLVVDAVDSDGETHDDVAFANVSLSGKVAQTAAGTEITNAPAVITADGSDLLSYNGGAFYPAGTALDPISASLRTRTAPAVSVSKVTFAPDESATVTVKGSGYYPQDVLATRLPLAGGSSGVYVGFGKYEPNWRPTANAASSARKNADVRWAVLAGDIDKIGGAADGGIELRPDGTFTAELKISKADADAIEGLTAAHTRYGVYTYPGGGAKFAAWETATPVGFVSAPVASNVSTKYAKGATVTVTTKVPGTVTVAGLGTRTTTAAGQTVRFAVPRTTTAGTKRYTVIFTPADTSIARASTTVTVKIAKVAAYKAKVKVGKKPTSKKKGKAVVRVRAVAGGAATTGKVRVKLTKGKKSKYVTANLVKGKRTVTLPKLAKGKWTIRAAYFGNANYTKRGYVKVGTVKVTK
ncbi:HtaA domain-containing protein [Aeromicrobium senzhongii]|uniref:HtaA domain-containing protein n=1 Tax=Aeromicrobium senzhongii TaxID=2663859 RepID=A0ABX6SRC4_9ACTN|nr:HtaA domain-containing protein [Aeromicrobium senzhongii]MTB88777.1 hypothetical protein [Aeromicrobium senzhongii]QNL93929.1 HtaA domain-containing protein [Aeromicrobium senzhongii]